MAGLRVPSIAVVHTVLKDPTRHQCSVLESVMALADQVVVMSEVARQRLCVGFAVDRHKVTEEAAFGSAWRDVMLYSSLISLFGRADNVEPSRIATTRE
jgi:hypothetical protein